MNVLVIGGGKAGAWQIRGRQLGEAIGARVVESAVSKDFSWADLVVLVKRGGMDAVAESHLRGLPIVWDALDFWSQPLQNTAPHTTAMHMIQNQLKFIKPAVAIGATNAMALACKGVYLPHHSWPGLEPAEARRDVQTVAYQGNAAYLGAWMVRVANACSARGWKFVINPTDLRTADILVAFRDGPWDGWMPRQWKSGVKLSNAIASGRPILTQRSAAWDEMQPPGSLVETESDLRAALDHWSDFSKRKQAVEACITQAPLYRLPYIASAYRTAMEGCRCAA
jgi:hypothetical protein